MEGKILFYNADEILRKDYHGILVEKANNLANEGMSSPHIHNHYEIYYLINGNSNYTIGDEIFHLEPKNIMLIPPGIPHKSSTITNLSRINIYFGRNYFSQKDISQLTKCFEKHFYTIPSELSTQFDVIFKTLLKEFTHKRPDSDLLIRNYTIILLTQLNRLRTREEINTVTTDNIIKDSLVYITEHLGEELSLESVAQYVALNPSYFSRKFKAVVGTNFKNYVIFARVGRAQQLLINSDLSLAEISNACGFQDSNYFSTVFKRIIGISPAKFRRQNSN
jgi:YesN/AraC family two-component response regulator